MNYIIPAFFSNSLFFANKKEKSIGNNAIIPITQHIYRICDITAIIYFLKIKEITVVTTNKL